ncbi:MAG: hypothetical protein WAZ36_11825 [Sediminibacterium sp.]
MSTRLQLIEQNITTLNGAAFQNLCDAYLNLRETNLASLNRVGSQLGKEKTTPGTPDTVFHLVNGNLRYVEFTTQATDLEKKIKEDISKCVDQTQTNIDPAEIDKIIIFYNTKLTSEQEHRIFEYARTLSVRIELNGIGWLALEILTKYLLLAREFLDMSLDSGQILPLPVFVEEYNNKGGMVSTPLDNIFFNREKELTEIRSTLESHDIILLEGAAGVGKTKIALQSVMDFVGLHADYEPFVIAQKNVDIYEDLRIKLEPEKNYILLVDDANRQQLNFQQLLGIFKEVRVGKIKLLITVRNYALEEVKSFCSEFRYEEINIPNFTDEEIITIISSDSFKIRHSEYQTRIINIAGGNARLAIMAARLAQKEQTAFLYGSMSDLYDKYFETFIKDSDVFTNHTLLKTLGLTSFFFVINRTDRAFIDELLDKFEIDYYQFNEALTELEKRELIEIQYNSAKVSEQVMATYFFYKVFIKDDLLSFRTLLFNYFPTWKMRFSDSIIPSHNMFGHNEILEKINPVLDEYQQSIARDEEKTEEYFSFFWFFKRDEFLLYYYNKISKLLEPNNPEYFAENNMKDFRWSKDKTLSQLSKFFPYPIPEFKASLELAFEYCRKESEELPELINSIREKMLFDQSDEINGFYRQVTLFDLLTEKAIAGLPHYKAAFFELCLTFLAHQYQITKSVKDNTISFYQYPIPFNDTIKAFRKKIWDTLLNFSATEKETVKGILKKFSPGIREPDKTLWEYDLDFYLPILTPMLDPKDIEDVEFVQQFSDRMRRLKIEDGRIVALMGQFTNHEYEFIKKLDWNFYKGKQDFEVTNYEEFRKLKEKQLREDFKFDDLAGAAPLFRAVDNILRINGGKGHALQQSLDIIIEENFLRDQKVGFEILQSLLINYPPQLGVLTRAVLSISNSSPENARKLLSIFKAWNHSVKDFYLLTLFGVLKAEFIDRYFTHELLDAINNLSSSCYLSFEDFEKYEEFEPDIIEKILRIYLKKNTSGNLRLSISYNFFEKFAERLSSNIELLQQAYFAQESLDNHYDFGKAGLKEMIKISSPFLITYIEKHFPENSIESKDLDSSLSFVWELELSFETMEKVTDIVIKNSFNFGEHDLNIFYKNLTDESREKVKAFLLKYAEKNINDDSRINALVSVIIHSLPDYFENFLMQFLSHNNDVEAFKRIAWIGNGGVYSGDVVIGEINAAAWQKVLTVVDKFPEQLPMLPIKSYIKSVIGEEMKSAELERQRKFSNPKW